MKVIGPGTGTLWPLAVFEQDGHAYLVHSEDALHDVYDDTYWDEISHVFDSGAHPVDVLLFPRAEDVPRGEQYEPETVTFVRSSEPDVSQLADLARSSLKRVHRWRLMFPIKATREQAEALDGMPDADVVSFFFSMLRRKGREL